MSLMCQTCQSLFANIYSETQANDCASDVFINEQGDREVRSHYGSSFDTSRFILTPDSILKLGIVCDKCLEKEINSGKAIEDKSFNYFDQIRELGLEMLGLEAIQDIHVDKFVEVNEVDFTQKQYEHLKNYKRPDDLTPSTSEEIKKLFDVK